MKKIVDKMRRKRSETTEAKIKRGWERVKKQLLVAGVHEHQANALVEDQDLGALARIVGELTGTN